MKHTPHYIVEYKGKDTLNGEVRFVDHVGNTITRDVRRALILTDSQAALTINRTSRDTVAHPYADICVLAKWRGEPTVFSLKRRHLTDWTYNLRSKINESLATVLALSPSPNQKMDASACLHEMTTLKSAVDMNHALVTHKLARWDADTCPVTQLFMLVQRLEAFSVMPESIAY
ncbi:MAG: hypothetical protein AWU57_340 [Marinobacter sp. T13-3]|nr:MAG: hypothetical protein AWU57_340 [Marinobacter sp. T13-3]